MRQCISCRKEIPENSIKCPNCGMSQTHFNSEKSSEESLKIILERYPQMKEDDVSSLKKKVEDAFEEKILNENQKESLLTTINAIGSFRIGQQLILASLITELATKTDISRQKESALLLRRYLKTLGMQEYIVNKLSDAFGLL